MNQDLSTFIKHHTGADTISAPEMIQQLWSGYGSICRYRLSGASIQGVILKRIKREESSLHPRGWNSDHGHERKLKSYQVEMEWYRDWSSRCGELCRVPHCFGTQETESESYILLEDLDAEGFPARPRNLSASGIDAVLRWLAHFHAVYLNEKPEGLWDSGTYWHLATRPDELAALDDQQLKQAAPILDQVLRECSVQSFVHGDAKLANFCFSKDQSKVAAVDFQYVGGGIGMKDLAYFLGSCMEEDELERREGLLLDSYFHHLTAAINLYNKDLSAKKVEDLWRPLFPVAWTDFHRFLKGWSPGHWKLTDYSERVARRVIAQQVRSS